MSDYSRVKKYENLRNDIEHDKEGSAQLGNTLDAYNKAVKEAGKEKYIPSHEKTFTKVEDDTQSSKSFKNEYLDSFIQEVREYNMQKGIRESENTKLDILQQLTTKNREKRANYIESIEESKVVQSPPIQEVEQMPSANIEETMEISRQVFALLGEEESTLNSDMELQPEVSEDTSINEEESVLAKRIAALEQKIDEPSSKEDDISLMAKRDLLEETMQLKIKMEEYEEELNEINSGVDSNNRLLNIIIIVLIFALLAVIGVVIYWLISGGILS